MIVRELKLFICAVQFLTRLPTPQLRDFQPEWIQHSARYYPLVGIVVGAICGGVLWLSSHLWPAWIAATLAIAVGLVVTGCFHEDGLADSADGIGGGQTRERRLEIMKDSRLGTYGASVLGLSLLLRISCAAAIATANPLLAALCLVASNGLGRSAAVLAMAVMPYGGNPGMAKEGKPDKTSAHNVLIAMAIGAATLTVFTPQQAVIAVLAGIAVATLPALIAWRLLGGRTGDVLGAVEQAFEIGFLLAMSALLA